METNLPYYFHNDTNIYFPPIFNQDGGSCVQASEIGYTLTYELNRLRNIATGSWEDTSAYCNLYSPLYSYNFLNKGDGGNGTSFGSGF